MLIIYSVLGIILGSGCKSEGFRDVRVVVLEVEVGCDVDGVVVKILLGKRENCCFKKRRR